MVNAVTAKHEQGEFFDGCIDTLVGVKPFKQAVWISRVS